MKSKIRLSQCMIVKNEEKNIRRALSWGKEIMWEQIVVDTGSTDQTVSIAMEMGAKVFHFQWIDDFASAKNYAIEKAQGDWIVFLDADEYLSPQDTQKLPSLLGELNPTSCDTVAASWVQINGGEDIVQGHSNRKMDWLSTVSADGSSSLSLAGTQIRLFRNRPGLRYQGRIHEKLYLDNSLPSCTDATGELAILHTGYSPEELKEKDKVARNIALVKKELETNPHDYQMLTYLGDSCFQQKNYEEAAHWYEQAVLFMPKSLDETNIQAPMVFKHLLLIYFKCNDQKVSDAYNRGITHFPKDADYDYLMGSHQVAKANYQEGVQYLQRALVLTDQYNCPSSLLITRNLLSAWDLLTMCYYETGQLKECTNCAITLLKADPGRMEPLKYLLSAFKKDEERQLSHSDPSSPRAASPAQVKVFLNNFYDFQNKKQQDFVRAAAQAAGYSSLLEEIG